MATVDLRTLPLVEQHHSLAFNELGRTGRNPYDYLWICPECDDGETHPPLAWSGEHGYFHVAEPAGDFTEAVLHKLIAVDVIAVLEQWRQIGIQLGDTNPPVDHMVALGAPKESGVAS